MGKTVIFCCLLALSLEGNFTAINSFQSYAGICWESDWFAMHFWVVLKEHKRYSLLCKRTLPWLNRKRTKMTYTGISGKQICAFDNS